MENTNESVSAGTYVFLLFLTLNNIMNFVDRQLLASFANFIIPDLGLTNTQFGLLTGFGFLFFYSIMGLFMGFLADRFNRPKLIAFGVALWSILTSVSGLAKNFIGLLIPRMFIGVGESILTPTSLSILGDRFPKERMGFISGAYYLGIPIGAGLSLIIAGYLGPLIGWRMCFYILGGIGVVFALIMFFIKDTPRKNYAKFLPESCRGLSNTNRTIEGGTRFQASGNNSAVWVDQPFPNYGKWYMEITLNDGDFAFHFHDERRCNYNHQPGASGDYGLGCYLYYNNGTNRAMTNGSTIGQKIVGTGNYQELGRSLAMSGDGNFLVFTSLIKFLRSHTY